MLPLHHFLRTISHEELPEQLNNPFHYTPHPLCIEAAQLVEAELNRQLLTKCKHRASEQESTASPHGEAAQTGLDKLGGEEEVATAEGKMLGVLVVETVEGEVGFLAAFSGLLMGESTNPWFVPPIYDPTRPDGYFRREEAAISAINRRILSIQQSDAYREAHQALDEATTTTTQQLAAMREELAREKAARQALRQQGTLTATEEAQLISQSQYQKAEYKRRERALKQQLLPLQQEVASQEQALQQLRQERKSRSAALQQWLFEQYVVCNARGEQTNIWQLFMGSGSPLTGLTRQAPPAGTGDCAAPKLLHYAYSHKLRPLALAEWWWGASPLTEIRTHGTFYPACRGKCGPLLTFMLQGLSYDAAPTMPTGYHPQDAVEVLYEDSTLAVVVKPSGLCSVPGTDPALPSLYAWARRRYPQAEGPLVVHRLDMDTSGLMLLALTPEAYRLLQQQFTDRTVEKRYEAILQGALPPTCTEGTIDLPLCLDPYDRPRQMVHPHHGKPALTRYRVLECRKGTTRIAFSPLTGRTHQLRVHAAHPSGLGLPILGDRLYGQSAERLHLHAVSLSFTHPVTGERLHFESPALF